MIAAFLCLTPLAVDGDTLKCADGTRVRIAGIDARERNESCHVPVCPILSHRAATGVLRSLTWGQTVKCEAVGRSYKRVVAVCSVRGIDLGCALVANGAAVLWQKYAVKYRMRPCN